MPVELTRIEEFALITLNRPEALNALSVQVVKDIGAAIDEAAASDARALLITGAGEKAFCAGADILIAAIGAAGFVKKDMVKDGAVVIDVGINRVEDAAAKKGYRIVGDVDFENVAAKCEAITPVPGGVGPMTIAVLLQNTLRSARKRLF